MIFQVVSADIKTMSGKEFNIVNGIIEITESGCIIYPEYEKSEGLYKVFTDTVYACQGNVDIVLRGAGRLSNNVVKYCKKSEGA